MATSEERARVIVERSDWDHTEGLHGSPIDYDLLTRLIADELRTDEARIAELAAWIRREGGRSMICTYDILAGEVCEGCRCERPQNAQIRQMIQSGVVVMDPAWVRDAQGSMRLVEVSLVAGQPRARELMRPSRPILSRLGQLPRFWWHIVWTADDVAAGWPWPVSWCSRVGYATAVVIKAIRWRLPGERALSAPRRTFQRRHRSRE